MLLSFQDNKIILRRCCNNGITKNFLLTNEQNPKLLKWRENFGDIKRFANKVLPAIVSDIQRPYSLYVYFFELFLNYIITRFFVF